MMTNALPATASQLPAREHTIADITRIKLGLANPEASGSKALNTIVDCLMQGALESFEAILGPRTSSLNKDNCRKIIGGKLLNKLSAAYVEKASAVFARILTDFTDEDLRKIDKTLNEGRSGKTTVNWPDWENFTSQRISQVIWDTPAHEKFDTVTSQPALQSQLANIQNDIVAMGSTLLSAEILGEMNAILTAPAPVPSNAHSIAAETNEDQGRPTHSAASASEVSQGDPAPSPSNIEKDSSEKVD